MQKTYHDKVVKEKSAVSVNSVAITAQNMQSKFTMAKTPVNVDQLKKDLAHYPNTAVSDELIHGFQFGFPLHYTGSRLPTAANNLKSALEHPDVVRQKIQNEIGLGRIGGPFPEKPISTLRVSPLGLVEKKDTWGFPSYTSSLISWWWFS